jgi:hypothetical protein
MLFGFCAKFLVNWAQAELLTFWGTNLNNFGNLYLASD